jgi:hypothetical protein
VIGINIDLSDFSDLLNLTDNMKSATAGVSRNMAAMIRGKAIELANQKLHSRRKLYVDALSIKEGEDDVWIVNLAKEAAWIDDGLPARSLLDGLLKSPKAKTSKSGDKYIIVPFDHSPGQGPASTTPQQQDLITEIKAEMKRRNIPFGKKEMDANGNAKMGRLHSFDITKAPLKTVDGPGMGHGPIGDVRQGNTGIPFLQGVSVYQGMDQKGKVKRSILTFRVASSKHKEQGKWEAPAIVGIPILSQATEWAMNEFDKEIVPLIMEKIINS